MNLPRSTKDKAFRYIKSQLTSSNAPTPSRNGCRRRMFRRLFRAASCLSVCRAASLTSLSSVVLNWRESSGLTVASNRSKASRIVKRACAEAPAAIVGASVGNTSLQPLPPSLPLFAVAVFRQRARVSISDVGWGCWIKICREGEWGRSHPPAARQPRGTQPLQPRRP